MSLRGLFFLFLKTGIFRDIDLCDTDQLPNMVTGRSHFIYTQCREEGRSLHSPADIQSIQSFLLLSGEWFDCGSLKFLTAL